MELHDLAAGYVLGILESDEQDAFQAHLVNCGPCQKEVADLEGSTEVLFEAAYESPPSGLKDRVVASIEATPQPSRIRNPRVRSARNVGWLVAAAVVILIVAVGSSGLLGGDPIDDILTAPDATAITVSSTGADPAAQAELELIYSPSLGEGVLRGQNLRPAAAGMIYQMWLIGADGPVPAGIFSPDTSGGIAVLVQGEPMTGQAFGITVEPAGGSDQPTGDVLYVGDV